MKHKEPLVILFLDDSGILQEINEAFPEYRILYGDPDTPDQNMANASDLIIIDSAVSDNVADLFRKYHHCPVILLLHPSTDMPEGWENLCAVIPFDDAQKNPVALLRPHLIHARLLREQRSKAYKYKTISDYTYDWEFWLSPDLTFSYCSPSSFDITGFEPTDFYRDPRLLQRLFSPGDWKHLIRIFTSPEEASLPLEFRILHANGEERWIGVAVTPVYDEDGSSLGVRVSNRDITDQIRIKKSMKERDRALRTLMSNLPGMAYRCRNDREWTMEFVSEGCLLLTGYPPEALMFNNQVSYNNLITLEDRDTVWDAVQHGLENDEAYTMTYRIRRADGTIRWVWEKGCGVTSSSGELQFLEGFIIDIHERIEYETSLRDHRVLLQREIDRKTQNLRETLEQLREENLKRRISEQELLVNQERYKNLVEKLNDAIWEIDFEGIFTEINSTVKRILGYHDHELLRQPFINVLYGRDRQRIFRLFQYLRKHPKSFVLETVRVRHQNGSLRYLRTTGHPFYDSEGNLLGFRGLSNDITRRVTAQRALRLSQERLSEAQKIAGIGNWTRDTGEKHITCSKELLRILGLENRSMEMTEEDRLSIVHPDDRETVRQHLALSKGERELISFEYRICRPDGVERTVHEIIRIHKGRKGLTTGYHGTVQDVTEEREMVRKLEDQLLFLQVLIDSIPYPIFYKDAKGFYLGCNTAFEAFIGYQREQVVGSTVYDVAPAELADVYHKADNDLIEKGGIQKYETQVRYADGSLHEVYFSKATFRDSKGMIGGLIGIMIDMTDQREIERQLRQAQKMETVGQLASGVAHEINTPVQFVLNNITYLRDSLQDLFDLMNSCRSFLKGERHNPLIGSRINHILDEMGLDESDQRRYDLLETVDESIEGLEQITQVVQAIKEFAHPSGGEKTTFSIGEVIKRTVTVSRNEWKNLAEMTLELDPDLPQIIGYPSEIEQVFLNLILNAAQAIGTSRRRRPEQMGSIMIRTGRDGDWVTASVSDNGDGIPEKYRERVFDPFFTTKIVGEGSGQGLTICYAIIVEKHGGKLTFTTETDKGTTFHIRLPIEPEEL